MDGKKLAKILTGILIVPMGIVASTTWQWWSKQARPMQIVSGIVILPLMVIAAPLTKWWDNFKA